MVFTYDSAREQVYLNNLATYVVLDLLALHADTNGDSGFCSPFDPSLSWLSAYTLRTDRVIQREGEKGYTPLFVCFFFPFVVCIPFFS